MQSVKFYFIFYLIFLSCQNEVNTAVTQKKYDFQQIETILKGETLNKEFNTKNSLYKARYYTCETSYVGNKNKSNELNLVFKSANIDSCYSSLNIFYNTHFNSTNTSKKFNSWSDNSLEVLLFKQTDSTILVNIFIKTYR